MAGVGAPPPRILEGDEHVGTLYVYCHDFGCTNSWAAGVECPDPTALTAEFQIADEDGNVGTATVAVHQE